jgi:hypothetical protein
LKAFRRGRSTKGCLYWDGIHSGIISGRIYVPEPDPAKPMKPAPKPKPAPEFRVCFVRKGLLFNEEEVRAALAELEAQRDDLNKQIRERRNLLKRFDRAKRATLKDEVPPTPAEIREHDRSMPEWVLYVARDSYKKEGKDLVLFEKEPVMSAEGVWVDPAGGGWERRPSGIGSPVPGACRKAKR